MKPIRHPPKRPWGLSHWKRTAQVVNLLAILGLVLLASSCSFRSKQAPLPEGENILIDRRGRSLPSATPTRQESLLIWFSLDSSYLTEAQVEQYQDKILSILESFHTAYPNIRVNAQFISDREVIDRYLHDLDHGFGPDLVLTKNLHLGRLFENQAIDAIDTKEFSIKDIRQDALNQGKYNGKYYAIPVTLGTQVLCYNKKRVQEVPKTIDDLVRIARAGYRVGITSNFGDTLWGLGIFKGSLFDKEGRITLDQGAWNRWMKFLSSIKNEPNIIFSNSSITADQAFIEGKLDYTTCWGLAISTMLEKLGENNVGLALLPGLPGQPATPSLTGFSFVLNPVSNENQKKAALNLAQFFTNIEQQQQWVFQSHSAISVNTKVKIDGRLFANRSILNQQSLEAISYSLEEIEKVEFMLEIGNNFYESVLSGAITPEVASTAITNLTNERFANPTKSPNPNYVPND